VDVHIFDQQQDLAIPHNTVIAIVNEVLRNEGKKCDEVVIHFVDTQTICELHSQYFNDPSTTDCISFPIDDTDGIGYCVLGEVFVCPKTAIDYATAHQSTPYKETTLYIVHGLLHLLGYDDLGEAEQKMRTAEKLHMKNLEKHNLILDYKG
jgi:probable rRNA maturation factor